MATNPMQRKAKNAFLGGVALMFVVLAIVVAFGVYKYKEVKDELDIKNANMVSVNVLTQPLKSGAIITSDMLSLKKVDKTTIPSNAIDVSDLENYSLIDQNGNEILYNANSQSYYIVRNGQNVQVQQEEGGSSYILVNGQKEYIEFKQAPLIAKVDMDANTIITSSMIVKSDSIVTNDVREQQYNMVILPKNIQAESYIDIRIMLPNGQDYIVVSKKYVKEANEDTIWIDMTEAETLLMSSAIVDSYIVPSAKLYATMYVEPGNQEQATQTYIPSGDAINLINSDPNIIETAKIELVNRYTSNTNRRQDIQNQLNNYSEEAQDNIEEGIEEEVTKSIQLRQEYMEMLEAGEVY